MEIKAKRKLSKYILAAFFINVFAIMSVGGVCIMMVRDMARDIDDLRTESGFVSRIYDMNNRIQETIFLVQSSVIKLDKELLHHAINIVNEVSEEVAAYQEEESDKYKHGLRLFLLFQKIQDNLRAIRETLDYAYENFSATQPVDAEALRQLESYGYSIQNLIEAINSVHFKTIERLVNESNTKMYYILFLYLTSSIVGIVASCVGYIVLNRNTIMPIIGLASATERVAEGDLSIRVHTNSSTEIGTLYNTFNAMIEKLQEHERRREDFSRELERQVRERTAELRASEESLRRAQDDLVRMEKIATLGQIATTVNHEIKTPLNVLYMNLQLLNKKIRKCNVEDEDMKKSMLDITSLINNEIIRINEIIEEFVKYARFPAPDIKENDFNKIVKDIAEMVSQNAEDANVSIEVSLDDSLGLVMVDDKKITQALLNLCMNAIQAMPEGGTLTLETRREERDLVLTVSDTGVGIPQEDLKRIFDPFFTKKKGGMGFGLAIVQRIIEDHRGRIESQSEEGKGTTFTIRLPLKTEE